MQDNSPGTAKAAAENTLSMCSRVETPRLHIHMHIDYTIMRKYLKRQRQWRSVSVNKKGRII